MYIWMIYKIIYDETCEKQESADIIEYTESEAEAISCTKLYNLQVPADLKDRIKYFNCCGQVT